MNTIRYIKVLALGILMLTAFAFIQQPGSGKSKPNDKQEKVGEQQEGPKGIEKKDEQHKTIQKGNESDSRDKKEKMGSGRDDHGKKTPEIYGKHPNKRHYGNSDNANKITICHKTGGHPVTISVSDRAWPAHQAHGDVRGECRSAMDKKKIGPMEERRRIFYLRAAEADEVIFRSIDVMDAAWDRIHSARLSILAARRSGLFTETQLQFREDRVVLVETRATDLQSLISVTQNRIRVNSDRVEVVAVVI